MPVHSHKQKHREPEEESHGEEGDANWIMSYADMMTLLVGFFALLYSFAQVDKTKFEKIRMAVAKTFGGKLEVPLEDLEQILKTIIDQNKLKDAVKVEREGQAISIIFQGEVFFDSGSAEIRENAQPALNTIIAALKEKAHGYQIHVEGHTDDNPISTNMFPSNWELSGARASRVVRILEEKNFLKQSLSAQGYADTRSVAPNRDSSGNAITENQAKNRRVVMKVEKN